MKLPSKLLFCNLLYYFPRCGFPAFVGLHIYSVTCLIVPLVCSSMVGPLIAWDLSFEMYVERLQLVVRENESVP